MIALVVLLYSIWKVRKAISKARLVKQGMMGEKAVGQYLERLRESGAKIFHDIPGPSFNLDHVIIHRTGVYVIETKTYSKPDKGEAILLYDGESISKNGARQESSPIIQSQAGSNWLKEILKESTGRQFPIRPVVVFPGWYIQPTAEAKTSNVWVLNPKALPAFISNSKVQITADDVNLCAYHLSRYVRTA